MMSLSLLAGRTVADDKCHNCQEKVIEYRKLFIARWDRRVHYYRKGSSCYRCGQMLQHRFSLPSVQLGVAL